MLERLPGVGDSTVRERIDEIFSREVLGSIFVGVAAGKIIEKLLNLLYADTMGLLIGWSAAFVLAVLLFVWWEYVDRAVETATETAEGLGP